MRNLEKAGGMASLLAAGCLGGVVFLVIAMLRARMLGTPGVPVDFVSPLRLIAILGILVGLTTLVVVLAVRSRLGADSRPSVSLATFAGILAAVLSIASGFLKLRGLGAFTGSEITLANRAFDGLDLVAVLGSAAWYLLVSLRGLQTDRLPKGLCNLGLTLGAASLLSLAYSALDIFVPPLSVAWAIWLGLTLLREPPAPLPAEASPAVTT